MKPLSCLALSCVLFIQAADPVLAQAPPASGPANEPEVLTAQQWGELKSSLNRATAWLASQQEQSGAFPSLDVAQPAVTSLGLLAFLAAGHVPGEGHYGQTLERSLEFVLSCQREDGLFCLLQPEPRFVPARPSHTATYNHAIAGLMLTEAYGMTNSRLAARIRPAVERAMNFTLKLQTRVKRNPIDRGGWRYLQTNWATNDSDLSVTGWQLMFLRSADNAGFKVSSDRVDEAMGFVQRCFEPRSGEFYYALQSFERQSTRGMVGAGILALSMGGLHDTPQARAAGAWLLRHPFTQYNHRIGHTDRFHYAAYYCSQGMFQLGGRAWREFYPPLFRTLVSHQRPPGCWDPEDGLDAKYGRAYSTALAVLALSPPLQILPIYQR